MTVWDMNSFSLNQRGGGGVGVALSEFTVLKGKIAAKDVISGQSHILATKFLLTLKEKLNISDYCFNIHISRNYLMHSGMGSTESMLMGIILVISELLELQLSEEQIISLFLSTVQEEHNGKVTQCFETAVGPWNCLKGGMVVVDKNCKLVGELELQDDLRVMLVIPRKVRVVNSIKEETLLLEGKGREFDSFDSKIKNRIFSQILSKNVSVYDNIFKYEIINMLKYIGSKRAEIEYQNQQHNNLYNQLIDIGEKENILISGMSSVGPTFYYIDKIENLCKIEKELTKLDVNIQYTSVYKKTI